MCRRLLANPVIEDFEVAGDGASERSAEASRHGWRWSCFPGTNCELDVAHALELAGATPELVWHRQTELDRFDAVVLPGGFAHGDYLRTGAIARFSPIMGPVGEMAAAGKPVLGICNGFQILCEAGLLPGAFIANSGLSFICRFVDVEVASTNCVLTRGSPGRSGAPAPPQFVRRELRGPRPDRPRRAALPGRIPTGPRAGPRRLPTRRATSSASCPIPNAPAKQSSAPRTG